MIYDLHCFVVRISYSASSFYWWTALYPLAEHQNSIKPSQLSQNHEAFRLSLLARLFVVNCYLICGIRCAWNTRCPERLTKHLPRHSPNDLTDPRRNLSPLEQSRWNGNIVTSLISKTYVTTGCLIGLVNSGIHLALFISNCSHGKLNWTAIGYCFPWPIENSSRNSDVSVLFCVFNVMGIGSIDTGVGSRTLSTTFYRASGPRLCRSIVYEKRVRRKRGASGHSRISPKRSRPLHEKPKTETPSLSLSCNCNKQRPFCSAIMEQISLARVSVTNWFCLLAFAAGIR